VVVNLLWQTAGLDTGLLFHTIGLVTVQTGVGGVVFLLAALVFRMEELGMMWNLIRRRKPLAEALT
jgi:hypothetical protein